MKRIYGLDVLRALAISLVIISHCTYILFPRDETNILILSIRSMGAIGVDLFFVLSGFLIGGILLKHTEQGKTSFSNLLNFWKRRWFRTLPNYYLFLIVNVLVLLIAGESIGKNVLLFIPFLQNFSSPHPDFFTEAWSLSVEEYAYLILPFLLFLSYRFFKTEKKHELFFGVTVFSILILFFFKLFYYLNTTITDMADWSSGFRKVVVYRLDSVYVGFLVVFAIRYYKDFFNSYKKQCLVTGLSLFALVHIGIVLLNLDPATHAGFFTLFYLDFVLLSIALLFPYFGTLKTGILNKTMVFLSTRSYAMYLVNYSVILLSLQRISNFQELSFWSRVGVVLLFLTLTILISAMVYTYFEKPILKYRDRNYKRL